MLKRNVKQAAEEFIKKADLQLDDVAIQYGSLEDFLNAAAIELMRNTTETVKRTADINIMRAELFNELAGLGDKLPEVIKTRAEYAVVGDITAEEARSKAQEALARADAYVKQYAALVDLVNRAKGATRGGSSMDNGATGRLR